MLVYHLLLLSPSNAGCGFALEYGGRVSSMHAGMVRRRKKAPVEGPNSYEQLNGNKILAWAGLRK